MAEEGEAFRAGTSQRLEVLGGEGVELGLGVVPEMVALIEVAEVAGGDQVGELLVEGVAEGLVAFAEVEDVIAVADGNAGECEGGEAVAVVERGGEVLEGGVDLAAGGGGHGVGGAVEADDFGVWAGVVGGVGVGGGLDEDAELPFAVGGGGGFEIVEGIQSAAFRSEELELVDVIGAGVEVVAGAEVGPFVAVDHDVDDAGVEVLEETVPLALREFWGGAEGGAEGLHEVDFEACDFTGVGRIWKDVGAAAFGVAAVDEGSGGFDAGEGVLGDRGGAGEGDEGEDEGEEGEKGVSGGG